jgi:hypothetical protein
VRVKEKLYEIVIEIDTSVQQTDVCALCATLDIQTYTENAILSFLVLCTANEIGTFRPNHNAKREWSLAMGKRENSFSCLQKRMAESKIKNFSCLQHRINSRDNALS